MPTQQKEVKRKQPKHFSGSIIDTLNWYEDGKCTDCGDDSYQCGCLEQHIEDTRMNFGVLNIGRILVIADLGLWNGHKQGYKILDGIEDVFYSETDYTNWYFDGHNLRSENSHHDGTNYLLYREIREDRNIDNLLTKIYNGDEISNSTLNYYTKSLKEYVRAVYH